MISPSGTFLYKLALRGGEAPWRLVASLQNPILSTGDDLIDARLVGHSPAVDIWGDRITLIAGRRELAVAAAAFITIDPDITRNFQGGDVLRLVRTGSAGLGASVVRDERLVLAVGAVAALPLGDNVQIVSVGDEADSTSASFTSELTIDELFDREATEKRNAAMSVFLERELRIRLTLSGEDYLLGSGDRLKIGAYDVLVDRGFTTGVPGTDECLAVSMEEEFPMEAAIRWARLLDDRHVSIAMVGWSHEDESL